MITKILTLFKMARRIAQSDIINIVLTPFIVFTQSNILSKISHPTNTGYCLELVNTFILLLLSNYHL